MLRALYRRGFSNSKAVVLSQNDGEAGYATAAASLVCLAIVVSVSAFMSYAASEARVTKRALRQLQAESLLEGGQILAAAVVVVNGKNGRLRWTETEGTDSFEILAEPEWDKVDAKTSADLDTEMLLRLGATQPGVLKSALATGVSMGKPLGLSELETTQLWRRCAASVLSYYGFEKVANLQPATAPDQSGRRPRIGEVWRIRVATGDWVDDRVVRLTGNGQWPTNLISRRLYRSKIRGEPCSALLSP